MRYFIFTLKFLFLGFFFIVSTLNLPLAKEGNFNIALTEYKEWIYSVAGEIGTLTGYVVDVEWLPDKREISPTKEEIVEGPRFSQVKR